MDIKKYLKIHESELDIDLAKKLISEETDEEIEEIVIEEKEIATDFDKYKYFGDSFRGIITSEQFKEYLKDLSIQFTNCLPDGFDDLFDRDSLVSNMIEDVYYIYQAQKFIEKLDEDTILIKTVKPSNYNCYYIEFD